VSFIKMVPCEAAQVSHAACFRYKWRSANAADFHYFGTRCVLRRCLS
jgi:hypothetical protein